MKVYGRMRGANIDGCYAVDAVAADVFPIRGTCSANRPVGASLE